MKNSYYAVARDLVLLEFKNAGYIDKPYWN